MSFFSVDNIAIVLGGFIVLIFYLRYFNEQKYPLVLLDKSGERMFDAALEPAMPKVLTYRYRYNLSLFLFIVTVESIYIVLAYYLFDFLKIKSLWAGIASSNPTEVTSNGGLGYRAIVAALTLTGILPNLKFVDSVLEKIRIFYHEQAEIPGKGQEVYRILQGPIKKYSEQTVDDMLDDPFWNNVSTSPAGPRTRILDREDFTPYASSALHAKWAKLTYLLYCVETWSKQKMFRKHIGNPELGWDDIKTTHCVIKNQFVAQIANWNTLKTNNALNTNMDILLSRTCRLVGCLLFMADRSSTRLSKYLKQIGYCLTDPPVFPIPFQRLALAAITSGFGITLGALIAFVASMILPVGVIPGMEISTKKLAIWVIYGIPFLMAPTAFVLMMKHYLSPMENGWLLVTPRSTHYRRLRDRPWHIYLVVSLCAYPVTFLMLTFLNVGFDLLKMQDSPGQPLQKFAVWSIVGIVTAAFVAYRIDSRPDRFDSVFRSAAATFGGSMLQAGFTMGAAYFAFMHINNNGSLDFTTLKDVFRSRLFVYLVMHACMGAAIFVTSRFNIADLERRRGRRKRIKRSVTFVSGDEKVAGDLLNISKNGALIHLPYAPEAVNETALLTIEGRRQPIRVKVVSIFGNYLHLAFQKNANPDLGEDPPQTKNRKRLDDAPSRMATQASVCSAIRDKAANCSSHGSQGEIRG